MTRQGGGKEDMLSDLWDWRRPLRRRSPAGDAAAGEGRVVSVLLRKTHGLHAPAESV